MLITLAVPKKALCAAVLGSSKASAFLTFCSKVSVSPLYSSCVRRFLPNRSHLQLYCQNFASESRLSRAVFPILSGCGIRLPLLCRWRESAFIDTKVRVTPCLALLSMSSMNFEVAWLLFLKNPLSIPFLGRPP